jgi:hypothetical protein
VSYLINEENGTMKVCNAVGKLVKPFDPRITGKFNYENRMKRIQKTGADLGEIELPLTLKSNFKRNYLP